MKIEMQDDTNTAIGFVSGILGGTGSFLLQIQTNLLSNMTVAVLTALLCGIAGIAGKELYLFVKHLFKINKKG
ncbi:MAG: hypothetical protein KGM16_17815 [Bacteroidota bacterium]|nr:hypothetical protein [Bacteroidota bacterium]